MTPKGEKIRRPGRKTKEFYRRDAQRTAFTWQVPVTLHGLQRSTQYNGESGLAPGETHKGHKTRFSDL